jgi:hypothetical protein
MEHHHGKPPSRSQSAIQGKLDQPGAQTERRGDAGPVRAWLAGETSPADFLACSPFPVAVY